jgi:mitochondrial intermembrane space import and assembly protein 40
MYARFLPILINTFRTEPLSAVSKHTTRVSPTQSPESLSAPHSDTSDAQTAHTGEKDGMPSEEEASSQGAFDPVTGKINWDCPCLGGMAYGPCGMQFREAFSCFVFSEQEPKGIDCVEKFKAMQDCFRENPDVYGEGKYSSFRQLAFFVTTFSNRNYERRRRR